MCDDLAARCSGGGDLSITRGLPSSLLDLPACLPACLSIRPICSQVNGMKKSPSTLGPESREMCESHRQGVSRAIVRPFFASSHRPIPPFWPKEIPEKVRAGAGPFESAPLSPPPLSPSLAHWPEVVDRNGDGRPGGEMHSVMPACIGIHR